MDLDTSKLSPFENHLDTINAELRKIFNSSVTLVEEIGRHTLLGRGKRLRPLIFVLSCQLCRYQSKDVYRLSTIFEHIHTASLLHDDVLDNATVRRKKTSANQIWGNYAAVLEGDFLFSKSLFIASAANNLPFFSKLTETTTRMIEGQFLELAHTNDWGLSREQYMKIITAKTALLISAACACGAIISKAEAEAEESLASFGLNAGVAFQLIDDVLDYTSSEEVFGKPVGKDLREGKITLPLIYTLSQLESNEKERLADLFVNQRADEEDYQKLIDLVRKSGAIERIRQEARTYVDKAAVSLDRFPDSDIKSNILELNQYIIDREL